MGDQKCEDNESVIKVISAKFKVVGSNKCNKLYKIVSKYGFKCDSKLNEFGVKMSLKDACCKCVDPDNQSKGKLTCKLPNYRGDGNCDDENNNKGCGYDGGDCCAKTVKGGQVKKNFCKMCKCIDPDNQSK